jgi:DNA-directed RNA polymerase subunit RPC12/RpoP
MNNYQCKKCGKFIKADSQALKIKSKICKSNNNLPHVWDYLGEIGDTKYQCKECRKRISSLSKPLSGTPGTCPNAKNLCHDWHEV